MKTEHTPTPWHIELGLHEYSIWGGATTKNIDRVCTLCGDKDFDEISNANAAFIVKAVNCHEELKEKLKMASKMLESIANLPEVASMGGLKTNCNWASVEIDEALAKAEAI